MPNISPPPSKAEKYRKSLVATYCSMFWFSFCVFVVSVAVATWSITSKYDVSAFNDIWVGIFACAVAFMAFIFLLCFFTAYSEALSDNKE